MPNPTAAMLVIGDEILSGRTRDANMHFLAQEFTRTGIDLREVRMVADDPDAIVAALNDLRAAYGTVVTSGGIGPTHDDITAEAVAAALDTPIGVRGDARAILAAHYEARGVKLNAARLRMARIPDGGTLIDNPVSAAPGFSLRNVHVMAGVPRIFEAMLAGLLPAIPGGRPVLSQSLRVERGEGDVAEPLAEFARAHPTLAIGSYPFSENGVAGTNIVIRGGDGAEIEAALVQLSGWLET